MKTPQSFGGIAQAQPDPGHHLAAEDPRYYSSDYLLFDDDDTLIASPGVDNSLPIPVPALIVDADQESRFYLRARLAIAGVLQADEAATGGDALYLLQSRSYRIVLLNMDVPDMNGWSLVSQAISKKHESGLSAALVLTGARMSWFSQLRGRFAGAHGCLRKPLDPVKVALLFRRLEA